MIPTIASILFLIGMGVVTYGLYILHPVAGTVTLGVMVMAVALLLYRSQKPEHRSDAP